jgi:hypothetical protein
MVTDAQLEAFRKLAEEIAVAYRKAHFPTLGDPSMSIEKGSRYARIVRTDGQRSVVHCFVDLTNGDVLKAASWKAPAKHARANLNDADGGASRLGPYGAM